jgi:hypothetical protein
MFRILLFDPNAAQAAAEWYDAVQVADSHYRNRRALLGKDRARLADAEAAAGHSQASEYRLLQMAIAEIEERDRDQATQVHGSREAVEEARLKRERALLDLQEARTALEYEEQAHYQHLFPTLGDTAEYVFLNILGGGGCLVCGSTGDDVATHLRTKLDQHRCPICDSPAEKHEKIATPADFSLARLRRLKSKVNQLRNSVETATSDIDKAEYEHEQLVQRREEDRRQLDQLRLELQEMGFIDVPSDTDIEQLRATVKEGEKELERLANQQESAEARYTRIFNKQTKNIDGTLRKIRRRFEYYASLVLAERCLLRAGLDRRPIGQEGAKFEFPFFEVLMTSGLHPVRLTPA